MKKIFLLLIAPLLFFSCQESGSGAAEEPAKNDPALVAACNWIQGGGVGTTGGEGGSVYRVTRLDDEKNKETGQAYAGTLRYAVEQSGARTIVFNVAGTIHLNSELVVRYGNLTIAGQTAPGDGICIAGYPMTIKASNVIVRFVRFRMGDEKGFEGDALGAVGCKNVVIDHCSCSWSTDECVSTYGVENFTMQYCFITESLKNSVHMKGSHGYGGIWGGKNATYHHNLLAHHDSRNPRFDHSYVDNTCKGPIDYVNNVVYNWGGNSTYGGEGVGEARKINMQNNYYKPGPASSAKKTRLLDPTTSCSNCSPMGTVLPAKFYLTGNYMYGSTAVTNDNWSGSTVKTDAVKASSRWELTQNITLQTAEEAFEKTLAKGGCSLKRDAIDARIVNEVRNGSSSCKGSNGSTNGLIDSQTDAGGWPTYSGTKGADSDMDGIPDEWETAHGLNPASSSDGKTKTLVTGHTNLEVYICDLVKDLY